jgi:hypothetical protein
MFSSNPKFFIYKFNQLVRVGGYLASSATINFRELLHTKKRQDETMEQLHAVFGESCISCELQLAGPEYECHQGISSLSPVVAEELFRCELPDEEICSQALSPDMTKLMKASVTIDNSLSPVHTLLQIHCADHKGLLYDILRPLKDCNIQV